MNSAYNTPVYASLLVANSEFSAPLDHLKNETQTLDFFIYGSNDTLLDIECAKRLISAIDRIEKRLGNS